MDNYVRIPGNLFDLVKSTSSCKSHSALVVYAALLAAGKQDRTRLSVKALSRKAGMSASTAKRATDALRDLGLIIKAGCRKNHRNLANTYIFNEIEHPSWSFPVPRAIFSAGLQAVDLAILITLFSFSDEDGICYPSQKQIADRAGLCRCTVNRHLATLEKAGWIAIVKRHYKTLSKKTRAHFTGLFTVFKKRQEKKEMESVALSNSRQHSLKERKGIKNEKKKAIITCWKRGTAFFRALIQRGCSLLNQLFNTT